MNIVSNNIYSNNYNNGNNINTKPTFKGLPKISPESVDRFISSRASESTPKSIIQRILGIFSPNTPKKVEVPKIADNLHEMILNLSKKKTLANGKDAVVHSIPGQEGLVIRIEKSILSEIDSLGKDLTLVPIHYEKSVAENPNLGLPLYFVAEKGSKLGKKSSLSPMEALIQPNKIMILKKVDGHHPSQDYWEKLTTLMGYDDFNPKPDQLNNFYFLGYIRKNFGNKAAIQCLENCKNGITELTENQLGEGSPAFKFVDGETFYKNYRAFSDSYIKSLKDISEMPQHAYDKAVSDILSPKNFIMDFQHTDNTFVDFEHQQFNFMDFCFDRELYPKYHYDNPIKEFSNVLMGKCFSQEFKSPRQLIMYPEDISAIKTYSNAIHEKVNTASPDKFKTDLPFRV